MNNSGDLLVLLALAAVFAVIFMPRKWQGSKTAHGTARWANADDLRRADMLSKNGLLLGRTLQGTPIRMPNYVHLSVFSPPGGGKTTGLAVPWLLTHKEGSMVVLDVKGELFRLTAEKRRALGQKVIRIDPFGVCGPGADSMNPLDLVSDGAGYEDEARAWAEALVIRTGEEKDPHWTDRAEDVLTSLLAFCLVHLREDERNLSSLRELLTNPASCSSALDLMQQAGGVSARLAGAVAQLEDKEKAGVYSTANRCTSFLDSEAIFASVRTSTFDLRELLNGSVTLYLVLPPHQLAAQARFLRLVIATLIRLLAREGMKDGKTCLFLLDEAGQLSHMPAIDQGLTLLRYAGLRLCFFFQSRGQLQQSFRGKESVLLDSTEQIYFGTHDWDTAERVSKMAGTATITVESASSGTSQSSEQGHGGRNTTWNSGRNLAVQPRELLKPDEVLTLNSNLMIAFLRNVPPILCRRLKWYEEPTLGGKAARIAAPLLWWMLLVAALGAIAWAAVSLP